MEVICDRIGTVLGRSQVLLLNGTLVEQRPAQLQNDAEEDKFCAAFEKKLRDLGKRARDDPQDCQRGAAVRVYHRHVDLWERGAPRVAARPQANCFQPRTRIARHASCSPLATTCGRVTLTPSSSPTRAQ